MDTTMSIKVPGTIVPYVICISGKYELHYSTSWTLYFKNTMVQIQHISVYNILHFFYI